MLTTVKLPKDMHAALEAVARARGITKSELLRSALKAELARIRKERKPTPYDLGKDLFGKSRSGRRDLSSLRARDLLNPPRRAKGAA